MHRFSRYAAFLLLPASAVMAAQQPAGQPTNTPQPTTAAQAPTRDTSYIDEKGTAHVTRVVPLPQTISSQAQLILGRAEPDQGPPQPLAERRTLTDAYTARARAAVSYTHLDVYKRQIGVRPDRQPNPDRDSAFR